MRTTHVPGAIMATRGPPVELFYDPAELDPHAPRLYVRRNGSGWELRDDSGELLGTHPTQDKAVDAALRRSRARFSEILVRGSTGRAEWVVSQNAEWLKLTRAIDRDLARRRHGELEQMPEAGRRKVGAGVFPGHRVLLPARYRHGDATPGVPARVELVYDPARLDPAAPRLHIRKTDGTWQLRDEDGQLLSSHCRLPDAMDAALERSAVCFGEILIRSSSGEFEWSLRHNPDWTVLARALSGPVPSEREAAA